MSHQPLRVLLADDEESLREALTRHLHQESNYRVDTAADAEAVYTWLEEAQGNYDVVLIADLLVPEPGQAPKRLGIGLTKAIKTRYPNIEIIAFTTGSQNSGLETLRAGAYRYLTKPINFEELDLLIQTAAEHSRLKDIAYDKEALFAGPTAITTTNSESVTKEAGKLHRLEKLSRAYGEIMGNLATMSLDDRLNLIAAHAADILDAETCGTFLVKDSGYLSLEASYGHREGAFAKGRRFPIQTGFRTGLTGYIAYEGKLFNAHGTNLTGHFSVTGKKSHTPSEHCYSLLAIPLKQSVAGQENLIGLLRADNKKDKNGWANPRLGFTQEDEWILSLFADAVVVAIEGAKLVVELNEQKDHWARLVASSPDAVIALDVNGRVTGFNEQAKAILGYQAAEVFGKAVNFLYDNPQEPHNIGKLLHAAPDGRATNYETFVRSKEGERIPICLTATQLVDARGNRIGSVGYFEDLRLIQAAEQRLELLLKASNTVARAKNLSDGLPSLAEIIVLYLDITFCHIFLLDENAQCLSAKTVYPLATSPIQLDWDPGPEEQIVVAQWPNIAAVLTAGTPKVLRIDDEQHRPFLLERSRRLGLKQDIQSLLLIPLRTREKVVGLLGLAELRPWEQAPFTRQKQNLAMAIANQTVMLIDQMHLHELTKRRQQLLSALDKASLHIRAEKETFKLLQEVVRLAVELVSCSRGGLYLNHPHLEQLELYVTYQLPDELNGYPLSHTEGLLGFVARTGQPRVVHNYADWDDREYVFEPYHFKTVAAVPLKQVGEIEAVLFVAHDRSLRGHDKIDLEILERFAAQASVALQTSRLVSREQRMLRQLAIFHRISDYIQAAGDLNQILHVVLTGVTAGYSLGFNRAALLLLDEQRRTLIGRMGIGHLNEARARNDWDRDHQLGLFDFGGYLQALGEQVLPPTPIDDRIRKLQLPVQTKSNDIFSQVILSGKFTLVTADELDKLPLRFIEAFEPNLPLIVAPLQARSQVIGLLVADNKFTYSPITLEDSESLMTFANSAAIAIDNAQLLQKLRSLYEASSTLVSVQDPQKVLRKIIEQARVAAGADYVSVLLIDEMGQLKKRLATRGNELSYMSTTMRRDGFSIQVLRTGRPAVIEDSSRQKDEVNPSMLERNIAAALCLPLSLYGKRIGVMWLNYHQPRNFPEPEIEALQLYVNQTAIAYDSARRIKELQYLHQAAEALASAEGIQAVLKQIVDSAREVLQADSAVIWSYDAVRNRFIKNRSVAAGIDSDLWQAFQEAGPQQDGTASNVMKKDWIGVTDTDELGRYAFLEGDTYSLLKQIGVRSFQGIALSIGEEKLGVLYVNYNYPRSFSEEEREMVYTFANHAALALKKAKLFDQVSKAWNSATVVVKVTTLENRDDTLQSVVEGMVEVVGCDAVTVYAYDQAKDMLSHPPTMIGVQYPAGASRFPEVARDSIVFEMLKRDRPYIVEDNATDPLFKKTRFAVDEGIASCIAIPLQVGLEKVGVVFVNYRQAHRFTADELTNIELFANQAAVAIRNAQLYKRIQKRAGTLEALYEAGRAVTGSLQLDEILSCIAEQAWKLMGARGRKEHFSHLALLDGARLQFKAAYPAQYLSGLQTVVGDIEPDQDERIGVTGRAFKTGQVQLAGEVTQDPDYIVYDPQIRSQLAAPVKMGEQVIGVISVEHPNPDVFSGQDRQALEALATYAAIAIENASLFEQTQRRTYLLDAAADVARRTTAILEIDELLNETVCLICECFGFYHVAVFLLDHSGQYVVLQAAHTSDDESALEPGHRLEVGREGILGFVAKEGQPYLVPDVAKDPHYLANLPQTRAEIAFPLIVREKVIGVLDAQSDSPGAWQEEDIATLQTMADQLAAAIDRARHYEELVKVKGLIGATSAVAWMGMVSAVWRHAVANDATTIEDRVTLAKQDIETSASGKNLLQRLDDIAAMARKIREAPITAPLSTEEEAGSVSINDLLQERLTQLWERDPYQTVKVQRNFELGDTATVRASPEWLRRAFDNLIDNAVKVMAQSSTKQLTVTTRQIDSAATIIIEDTGPGIPDDVQARLFQNPIEKPKGVEGLGMGLLITKTILHTYRGEVEVESTGPKGTAMQVRLPLET